MREWVTKPIGLDALTNLVDTHCGGHEVRVA